MENSPYTRLANAFTELGKAFSDINEDIENPPAVKILVMQIAGKMNLGDNDLTELIGFLQYCSANKDFSMSKLALALSNDAKQKTEEPKTEEPKTEEQKTEEPKTEEPKNS